MHLYDYRCACFTYPLQNINKSSISRFISSIPKEVPMNSSRFILHETFDSKTDEPYREHFHPLLHCRIP